MKKSGLLLFTLCMIIVGLAVTIQREWIDDFYLGMQYEPSGEVAVIRDKLGLTERGEFLFKAARPKLSEGDEFDNYCRKDDSETAVLGCYADGNIYIYNMDDEELSGIKESTMAHELLHAVFARMSYREKEELRGSLEKVLAENKETLGKDLENYEESEKYEELYVRAGTEVKSLPKELREHFEKIFKNQEKIVSFYDEYMKVFNELEDEIKRLKAELEKINSEIEIKAARGEYAEANELIEEYNQKVETYNENVLRGEKLKKSLTK